VTSDGWNPALELLFQNLPEILRVFQTEDWMRKSLEGEFDLSGLWGAFCDGKLVGTIFFLLQTDHSALVWAPQCVPEAEKEVAMELIRIVNRKLDKAGVSLAQALLELREESEIALMVENGYQYLADLIYMECDVSGLTEQARITPLQQIPYNESENHARFVEVMERTYRDTLDCPRIQGLRTPDETLHSHKTSGKFHPDRWNLYTDNTDDFGLMLLTDHPEQNAWELVYMGLVPEARGRGLGLQMVQDAIQKTKEAGRKTLLVAVDKANRFARKVYKSASFQEIALRRVLMRTVEKTVE